MIELESSRPIEEIIKSSYLEYASEVISHRSLPDYRDGLKRVQRRILLTLGDLGLGEIHKSASVIGEAIKRYHPHGDSTIYDSIVNMVNSRCPLLVGEGNFGFKGLEIYPAAAFRYTSVGLTNLGKCFLELRRFSKKFINENDYEEVEYLPTPIPYCLLSGSIGVGVGVATLIPRFESEDLIKLVFKILKKENHEDLLVRPANGQTSDEDLINLNEKGYGKITYKPRITMVYDETGQKTFNVSVENEYVNLSKILVEFKNEIEEDMVYVLDKTSGPHPTVTIGRTKRVRKITDEEIVERLKKCLIRTVKTCIVVADGGKARVVGVKEYVANCIEFCLSAYKNSLEDSLQKIEREIRIEKIKPVVSEGLLKNKDDKKILEEVKDIASEEDVKYLLSRSISSLRPRGDLEKKKKEIKDDIEDLNNSYSRNVLPRIESSLSSL